MILNMIKRFRRKKIIASIRESMLFFGHDLSDTTDEELEAAAVKASLALSCTGLTAKQAAEGLRVMSCAGNSSNWKEYYAMNIEEMRDRF